jgi:hypothetical protein
LQEEQKMSPFLLLLRYIVYIYIIIVAGCLIFVIKIPLPPPPDPPCIACSLLPFFGWSLVVLGALGFILELREQFTNHQIAGHG